MSKKTTITVAQAQDLAKQIAQTIQGGEVFALIGPLGAGKTTFVKYLAQALGYKKRVTSPTFTLEQVYQAKNPKTNAALYIYHLDLYRLESAEEAIQSGITESWGAPDSITLIEWADKTPTIIPKHAQTISFTPLL